MSISKQWLKVFLRGNSFYNVCAPDMQHLGLCNVDTTSDGLSSGAIAGIVIGVLVGAVLLAGLAWVLVGKLRRRDASVPRMPSSKGVFERFEDAAPAPLE